MCTAQGDGYGMGNRSVDDSGRLTTLRFLHVPKTGTSFIIALRNYLSACQTKDKSCARRLAGNRSGFRFPGGTTYEEISCGFALDACSVRAFHRPFRVSEAQSSNYVTLLRQPLEQAISSYFYVNGERELHGKQHFTVSEFVTVYDNVHVKVSDSTIPFTLNHLLVIVCHCTAKCQCAMGYASVGQ
jgi:hypothetical protein